MKDNHILPFLWMRGEEEAVLREELAKIYEAGIRSVCLEARPHPDYAGEGWWHDVDIVIDEAKKRGMTIWILDDAHFPTGMANNSLEKNPDKARRWIYTNFVDVTGPMPAAQVDVDLLMTKQFTWMDIGKPETKPLIDETKLLSVTASKIYDGDVIEGEPVDLTSQVVDGYLTADIPEGTWRINVNFATTAIGPKPEYVNYVEEDSVRILIDEVYEKHYAKYQDLFGTVIEGFFSDEPGFYTKDSYDEESYVGVRMTIPWGREMSELMSELYEGDVKKDITYLFADEKDGGHRAARYAYMDAVSRLYGKNFCKQLGDWCRAHNVRYIGHVVEDNCGYMRLGAGVGHYFRSMSGQDMAGIDNIGYQLMPCNDVAIRHTGFQDPQPEFYHYYLGKLGGSCAAIDPLKKGRLMCENFGAYGWRLGPRDMKWLVDYLVGQGVNYFVPHAFSMAEYPDVDCPPHFYARGNNPQFPYFCELMRYTDRLCNLFSEGTPVVQAGVLFEAEADWTGKTMRGSKVGKELITHQVDFFVIPADVFTYADYFGTEVKDGKLVVNGNEMKVLIVPECEFIPAEAAKFIAANPELEVLYINKKPIGIAGPAEDPEGLLAKVTEGRKCVAYGELGDYLRANGCCDALKGDKTDGNLHQYHYIKDGKDYWLLMNTSSYETVDVTFSLPEAKSYGKYDAMKDVVWKFDAADKTVNVVLGPYQSTIICTDPENAVDAEPEYALKGSFALTDFDLSLKKVGTDEIEKVGKFELKPVSNVYRDFSGEIIYETSAEFDAVPDKAVLSAQYVFECMSVEVNGTPAGTVFTPPYSIDITPALKAGANDITVNIATTPLRDANTKPGFFGKERSVIEPTGMFGEVKIELYEKK